eukprot:1158079-Pelagomonas_calceolata.AAC.1
MFVLARAFCAQAGAPAERAAAALGSHDLKMLSLPALCVQADAPAERAAAAPGCDFGAQDAARTGHPRHGRGA